MKLEILDPRNPCFPDPLTAMKEPDGLLAAGGNLDVATLLSAYCKGIFPWYQEAEPILWWSPSERCIIRTDNFHISKSLSRTLRQDRYKITLNKAFAEVIRACAEPRGDGGTWITDEMIHAYERLHHQNQAHSVEVWEDKNLVGGIYGVSIGKVFCGESMFSRVNNGSKIAIAYLISLMRITDMKVLDCQLSSRHLHTLGAVVISRQAFITELTELSKLATDLPRTMEFPESWWTETVKRFPVCK